MFCIMTFILRTHYILTTTNWFNLCLSVEIISKFKKAFIIQITNHQTQMNINHQKLVKTLQKNLPIPICVWKMKSSYWPSIRAWKAKRIKENAVFHRDGGLRAIKTLNLPGWTASPLTSRAARRRSSRPVPRPRINRAELVCGKCVHCTTIGIRVVDILANFLWIVMESWRYGFLHNLNRILFES